MARRLSGRSALVTGASGGIGAAIAASLAGEGANLLLVARRRDALEAVAREIGDRAGVAVSVRVADLAQPSDRASLADAAAAADILVNNAGLGVYGPFAAAPLDGLRRMLAVNVEALVELTHVAVPAMRARGWGRILQVSSTASFQPVPAYAAYAATKALVTSFGVALNDELRGSGVTCTTLCPGTTDTAFFAAAGHRMNRLQRASAMAPEAVARLGVDALIASRPLVVAGRANRVGAWGGRLLPPSLAARIGAFVLREGA